MRKLFAIGALFAATLTAPSYAGLVAHYKFDETSGNIAYDSSGNGNNLQWAGSGNAWNQPGAFGTALKLGTAGSVVARTGGAQAATIANLNGVTGNSVTIAFWAKPNKESQGSSLFWIGDSTSSVSNDRVFQSHVEWTNGQIYWDVDYKDGTDPRVNAAGGLTADKLHHYALMYNGGTGRMEIWKDGSLLVGGTEETRPALPWNTIRNFEIGAFSFTSWWGGGIVDDFAIYNQALTADEIRSLRVLGNGSAVPEPVTATMSLMGLGALAAGAMRRRRA